MNAPMVLKDGKVWAVFGTPGADDQVQTNLQVAVGLMDYDLDPQSLSKHHAGAVRKEGRMPTGHMVVVMR
ncbi:hypothetical protein BURKHO8Y_460009 [Burkholderia sp. 8Y]|nr:hypothetical protein BURKHO8Y_460009 [Burkholderia sp. 8Y]